MQTQDTEGDIVELTNTTGADTVSDAIMAIAGFVGVCVAGGRKVGQKFPLYVRGVFRRRVAATNATPIAEGDIISFSTSGKTLQRKGTAGVNDQVDLGKALDAVPAGGNAVIRIRLISQ